MINEKKKEKWGESWIHPLSYYEIVIIDNNQSLSLCLLY